MITRKKRRAALGEFKKFKGAGPGATEALEAQRRLGALYEMPHEEQKGESID